MKPASTTPPKPTAPSSPAPSSASRSAPTTPPSKPSKHRVASKTARRKSTWSSPCPTSGNATLDYCRQDVFEVVRAARAVWKDTTVKVILETAALTEEQTALGCLRRRRRRRGLCQNIHRLPPQRRSHRRKRRLVKKIWRRSRPQSKSLRRNPRFRHRRKNGRRWSRPFGLLRQRSHHLWCNRRRNGILKALQIVCRDGNLITPPSITIPAPQFDLIGYAQSGRISGNSRTPPNAQWRPNADPSHRKLCRWSQ